MFICLLIAGFIGGYSYSTYKQKQLPFRSIMISKEVKSQEGTIINIKELSDNSESDFTKMDNIEMIFFNSTNIENVKVDVNKPDLYIVRNSNFVGITFGKLDAKVWFTSTGGIIAIRKGETWDKVEYKSLTEQDAKYLQDIVQ